MENYERNFSVKPSNHRQKARNYENWYSNIDTINVRIRRRYYSRVCFSIERPDVRSDLWFLCSKVPARFYMSIRNGARRDRPGFIDFLEEGNGTPEILRQPIGLSIFWASSKGGKLCYRNPWRVKDAYRFQDFPISYRSSFLIENIICCVMFIYPNFGK